jgi:tRNA(fMet)-specific endonuclease VapC
VSGRRLLDTNIVIALLAEDPAVLHYLQEVDEVFVPCIVLGELYFGAGKSSRVERNTARIDQVAIESAILGCDAETARLYGQIKAALRTKGQPIPENDIWISAIAHQHGLTLVTRDAHFEQVDGLQVELW